MCHFAGSAEVPACLAGLNLTIHLIGSLAATNLRATVFPSAKISDEIRHNVMKS
jgi:hypothetical protein